MTMASDAKLTRIRLEALGADPKSVSLFLAELAGSLKATHGGEWEEEEPGVHTLPTSEGGTWGRLIVRRKKRDQTS